MECWPWLSKVALKGAWFPLSCTGVPSGVPPSKYWTVPVGAMFPEGITLASSLPGWVATKDESEKVAASTAGLPFVTVRVSCAELPLKLLSPP